jgi:flavin-dependent dehydrogenase
MNYDVAIIGGGPAGSTVGTLLRKYNPSLNCLILERETFPREHVGESQLPRIGQILDEMGVWEKVEAANFPIKIGATYRWGASPKLWDFEFLPADKFVDEERPAALVGQRRLTAFQVDRAVYDKILLDHAASMGCEVREGTGVKAIESSGDEVTALVLADGERVTARHYVDASGGAGILRRSLNVEVDIPSSLQNIAFWDYWENAEWAVHIGVGGTKVQVLSLGYGWIWFIPLGPTRTSIGLIVPAEYYKKSGLTPEEVYHRAIQEEPRVRSLIENATPEGEVRRTRDWSFVAKQMVGPNWFLAGESCGFADPILAAGMTLAHVGAQEVAYTILELDRGEHDPEWLRSRYEEAQSKRIRQHVRFADFWYSANGQFTELKEFCASLASEEGLELSADAAFLWLGTGGFLNDKFATAGLGEYSLGAVKGVAELLTQTPATWQINRYNEFQMNLVGATEEEFPMFVQGRIVKQRGYARAGKCLPYAGMCKLVIACLARERRMDRIFEYARASLQRTPGVDDTRAALAEFATTLEALLTEGWVKGKVDKKAPFLSFGRAVGTEGPIKYNESSAEVAR